MRTIVIEVSGGVVQEVYANAKDTRIIIVDWDKGESPGDDYSSGELNPSPFCSMPEKTQAAVSSFIQ